MLDIKPIFNALLRSKAGALMLLVQIALTTAIVSNAAFIINDRATYLAAPTGYDEQETFSLSILTYGENDRLQQLKQDINLLRNDPEILSVTPVNFVPLSGSGSASAYDSKPIGTEGSRSVSSAYLQADQSIFETLGIKIIEGRNFTPAEVQLSDDPNITSNIVIISKHFADEMFPEGDALGNTFYDEKTPLKVIGITEPIKGPWLRSSIADYIVINPVVRVREYQKLIIRTEANQRASVMKSIESTLLDAYNERVISNVKGLDAQKDKYNASDVLMKRMLTVLIAVLVAVTALGIFGLTLFNINKRTKQIGTRRALGARRADIIQYFMVENTLICTTGLVFGCIGAVFLGRLLMQNYSLPALDHVFIGITALGIFALSLLAVIMPAQRAANISPSIATRSV